jgi:hypothetical protein
MGQLQNNMQLQATDTLTELWYIWSNTGEHSWTTQDVLQRSANVRNNLHTVLQLLIYAVTLVTWYIHFILFWCLFVTEEKLTTRCSELKVLTNKLHGAESFLRS